MKWRDRHHDRTPPPPISPTDNTRAYDGDIWYGLNRHSPERGYDDVYWMLKFGDQNLKVVRWVGYWPPRPYTRNNERVLWL